VIEQRFGAGAPWAVGVEEELMILDAETLALAPRVETLLQEAEQAALPAPLKPELFASIVELNTPPAVDAHEAAQALADGRRFAAAAAERHGLRIAAGGSHPFSRAIEQEIYRDPRYLSFAAHAGPSARRQGVSGLHVHVSMPSAEVCYRALENVLPWLPLVLALSANSPYFDGLDTGLASCRAEVLALLPRAGAPPAFGSYAAWERDIERFARLGVAEEYTRYWWDVRLHPRLGTLELRMPDQPTSVTATAALAALLQALAVTAARAEDGPVARRMDYAQNRWAAARFGPRAELVHPDGERLVPVAELAAELVERVEPAARELGSADLLALVDPSRCEGDSQLEVGRAQGVEAVAADLVRRTRP
jgi:carboxylate-amine ligase